MSVVLLYISGEPSLFSTKFLHLVLVSVLSVSCQYCNGVDWRQKLDSQRGAVLATELKNNSYKLARWTCCAMLAGSEYLKLG